MDEMTENEKLVVEQLRKRTINDVTPKMLEDVSLFYRFAKARNFNLADAETMLREHISLRKELKLDTILTDYQLSEAFAKYAPTSFVCFDKEGSIVRYQDLGRSDASGIWSIGTKKDWVKFGAYIVEQDMERMIKRGGNLGKPMYSAIDDFQNLTYANAISVKNIQNLLYLFKMFADHYPETLKFLTVINVPSYFAWLYSALSPIFPATITQKVRIFGADGWKETLLKEINPEDLPVYLGGTRTDPDGNPNCESFMIHGQPIPKHYYLQKRKKTLSKESDVEKLTVLPFSKEEITFEVKEENSYLEWEFQTKNRDIDFILLFRRETPKGFEMIELIPKQKIDTSYEPEKGFFKCDKAGDYIIVFDNSSSWIHSKEVYYRAGIKDSRNYSFNT